MGYRWPPPPSVYSPLPRPLHWHDDGAGPVPDDEDAILFGIGVDEGSITQGAQPLVAELRPGGGQPWVQPRAFLKWQKGSQIKTDDQLLSNYRKMVAARAPEDPPQGGLAADFIDPSDGTICLHYWDFSDDNTVRRKRVFYTPKKKDDVGVRVEELGDDRAWHDEGFDFERDFTKATPGIAAAVNVVSTAIVSIFATPAVGAAWSAVMGGALKMAQESRSGFSIEGALEESLALLSTFTKEAGIGAALATDDGKKLSEGIYKAIGVAQKEVGDFATAIGNVVAKAAPYIPKLKDITVTEAIAGKIPVELLEVDFAIFGGNPPAPVEHIPGTLSFEWNIATVAFAALAAGDHDSFYSWRKLSMAPDIFDTAVSSLQASAAAEQANRDFQARQFLASRDPSATLTWRSALALSTQTITNDPDATKTFRQAAARMGISVASAQSAQQTRARRATAGVGVVAVLAAGALARKFLF